MEIPKLIKGQKALVTGSSSGIGAAVAKTLAKGGADVVVNYSHGKEKGEEVAHECCQEGVESFAVGCNVADPDDVKKMFQTMFDKLGTIDILVANAGMQQDAPFDQMSLEQWNKVLGVNLTGQFLCAQESVREFKRRGVKKEISCAAGKIICMSSVHEIIPWTGHANYASSKGGVHMLMQTIAQECAGEKIRVNAIGPGAIRTPINKEAWDTEEAMNKLLKLIPYDRIGEPEDIGQAALFLASDLSDYITGITLFVDGGMTLYPGFRTGG